MLYVEDVEVGSARTSGEFELTEQDVVDIARTWDPQPFHVDPGAARRSPFRGLTASACHVFSVAARLLSQMEPLAVIVAARHELDLVRPARPGDHLSMTVACVEKHASRTKPDHSTKRFDSELKTADGSVTARLASTIVPWRITRSSSAAPLSRESPLVRPPGHLVFTRVIRARNR
jgi:acyl dehydratase